MICPVCKKRHALFPEEDFEVTGDGFVPKNSDAVRKNKESFDSNEEQECVMCEYTSHPPEFEPEQERMK
ncbi:MAG: hypothetical protein A2V69_00865 [Candidatus Portnoybacteria bacterium RBG_13_40_8]|uniref:Uncharacterized protein n=1 Tax=Candidatus Portnoybacteria bacterium RBG_13_40_8 TaxID=1801990 RepID=A0A1G2F3L7_9BACT|nr:MAG: hypothetical protein A2V69_00865 [Candidatus Portnoybacteria bacterium RBG_13_40_8]OGZ35467.1 MAG: hypothetical protein A2V60_03460 [Candidatus Portnoybacteria bacterium RIFCSPHIGHO2_01_FULL_39_19]